MDKEKKIYNNHKIKFTVEDVSITALNLIAAPLRNSIPRHYHGENSYEIHYIPNGYSHVDIDGRMYDITPNTLYITGPHVEHEQFCVVDSIIYEYSIYFIFDEVDTKCIPDSVVQRFRDVTMWFGQDTQNLHTVLEQIFFELEHTHTGYQELVRTLLSQCIIKIVRNYENITSSDIHFPSPEIAGSKALITEESFLYDCNILTLDMLSDRLGLSRRQTDRFLKNTYSKTFLELKQSARMAAAQQMLREKDDSIEKIAEHLNYSSTQHFYSAFKKHFNISPGNYRSFYRSK